MYIFFYDKLDIHYKRNKHGSIGSMSKTLLWNRKVWHYSAGFDFKIHVFTSILQTSKLVLTFTKLVYTFSGLTVRLMNY